MAKKKKNKSKKKGASDSVRVRLTTVTPRMAAKIMGDTEAAVEAGNFTQRHVTRSRVELYKSELSAGRWQVNGETISLSKEGYVLNGQHRLQAIIETNIPMKTLVAVNVPKESFPTMDTPLPRSASNTLEIAGIPRYTTVSAALRWVYGYRNRKMLTTRRISNSHVLELLEEEPDILDSVAPAANASKEFVLPQGPGAFAHYIFAQVDRKAADEFMARLADGAGMKRDDAILVARTLLLKRHRTKGLMRTPDMLATVFKAWTLWREGKPAKGQSLSWRSRGPTAEDFPYLDGHRNRRRRGGSQPQKDS